jgi:hypothetical protein
MSQLGSATAERDKALWEKRCATYEEILVVLDGRQAYRRELAHKAQATKVAEVDFEAMLPLVLRYTNTHDLETLVVRET